MVYAVRFTAPGQIQMKPISTEKNEVVSNLVLKITIPPFKMNMKNALVPIPTVVSYQNESFSSK